jgi:hypothetical protein
VVCLDQRDWKEFRNLHSAVMHKRRRFLLRWFPPDNSRIVPCHPQLCQHWEFQSVLVAMSVRLIRKWFLSVRNVNGFCYITCRMQTFYFLAVILRSNKNFYSNQILSMSVQSFCKCEVLSNGQLNIIIVVVLLKRKYLNEYDHPYAFINTAWTVAAVDCFKLTSMISLTNCEK